MLSLDIQLVHELNLIIWLASVMNLIRMIIKVYLFPPEDEDKLEKLNKSADINERIMYFTLMIMWICIFAGAQFPFL